MNNIKKKGFTLIELIVVIAILGILAAILIPKFTGFQDKAKASQALVEAKSIATAIDGLIFEGATLSDADSGNVKTLAGLDTTGTLTITVTDPATAGYASGYFKYVTEDGKYAAERTAANGGKVKMTTP